jgi:hypothetical protein
MYLWGDALKLGSVFYAHENHSSRQMRQPQRPTEVGAAPFEAYGRQCVKVWQSYCFHIIGRSDEIH